MTDRELMQQALEALEAYRPVIVKRYGLTYSVGDKAITVLRERLAQPDPVPYWHSEFLKHNTTSGQPAQQQSAERGEPVAWMHPDGRIWTFGRGLDKSTFTIPLYTSPQPSKPLTMQERTSIVRANTSFHDKNEIDAYGIIDDVEAAHGIKE